MDYQVKLEKLIEDNHGLLLTKEVTAAGVPRAYIKQLVEQGTLERLERGVYISSVGFDDAMYRMQVKYPTLVFSHDTALYLHDLSDRDPLRYSVTVPAGYNAKNLKSMGVKVYYIKKELHGLGVMNADTPFGRTISVYDRERTICDIIRSRKQIDIALLTDAMKRYSRNRDKNLPQLMQYAAVFKVEKLLRTYLEVLI